MRIYITIEDERGFKIFGASESTIDGAIAELGRFERNQAKV